MVADCHSILARWRNHYSQLLCVQGVNDITQREIYKAESLVPELGALQVEMVIEKLTRHKSSGND